MEECGSGFLQIIILLGVWEIASSQTMEERGCRNRSWKIKGLLKGFSVMDKGRI